MSTEFPEFEPERIAHSSVLSKRQQRNVLIAVCMALMAVIAAVSGLNVAQASIAIDLNASHSQVLWIINIYTLALAALLLPLGAVGDRWGRKPVLMTGLVIFGLANGAAALAQSAEWMLVARMFAGVGAAMIMPVTLSAITSAFPPVERSRAIGVWTAVAGGGGILGMFLSAALVDFLSWRWLFALPIVLVIAALWMTIRAIPNSREQMPGGFDLLGSMLSMIATAGLILFIHEGPERGWTSDIAIASLVAGTLGATGFVVWDNRQRYPLLDIRLFRNPGLSSGSISLLIWFGVQAGIFVVMFPYFQIVLGWSGLRATVAFMPMALLMMVSSTVAPRVSLRFGSLVAMISGVVLGSMGLLLMAIQTSADGGYLDVLPGMLVIGLGMGLAMTPSTESITSALGSDKQGIGSALNDVTREFGTALGVAMLGAVFTAGYGDAMRSRLGDVPEEPAEAATKGIANAVEIAHQELPYSETVFAAASESFVVGWQQSMWTGLAIMLVLLGYLLVAHRGRLVAKGARTDVGGASDPVPTS